MNRSVFAAPSLSPASCQGALLTPGDQVTCFGEAAVVFEIVHISHQKAWVRSLGSGSQQIVGMGDLQLIMPTASASGSLH